MAGVRVTCVDLDTGDEETKTLGPGEYFVITTAPMYVAHENAYPTSGTVQLTIKRAAPGG